MNMETKYTKGEWRAYDPQKDTALSTPSTDVILIVSEDGDGDFSDHPWCIADVQKMVSKSGDGIANAKLIAAAPELLEALIRLCETNRNGQAQGNNWNEAYKAINKAI